MRNSPGHFRPAPGGVFTKVEEESGGTRAGSGADPQGSRSHPLSGAMPDERCCVLNG